MNTKEITTNEIDPIKLKALFSVYDSVRIEKNALLSKDDQAGAVAEALKDNNHLTSLHMKGS